MNGTLSPFEDDILTELLDAQRGLGTRRASRRPARQLVAAVGIAAVAGGVATAVVVTHDSSPSATPRSTSVTTPRTAVTPSTAVRALTVAAILQRSAASMAHVDTLVLHMRETRITPTPEGPPLVEVYESWMDRGDPEHSRTKRWQNGEPDYDIQTDSAAPSELFVNYRTRQWFRGPTIDYTNHHIGMALPDVIEQQIKAGGLTLVGHETINGRDTLHLTRHVGPHDVAPYGGDLWIDPTTYLLIRTSNPFGSTDYEWLARNAASRSKLVPVVPPGFTFSAGPPVNGAG